MVKNLKNNGEYDLRRVHINEEWEINFWTEELHCSEADLRAAIEIVGRSADELRIFLHG